MKAKLIWPPEAVGQLHDMLQRDPDKIWRVDKFPNLVTYQRMTDALKKLCIAGDPESTPSAIVQEVVTSYILSRGENGRALLSVCLILHEKVSQ